MFLYKKIIASISSTLFVASFAKAAPLVEEKVRARELDSTSCSCEITDLFGSEFSCTLETDENVLFTSSNFGEEGSIMEIYNKDNGLSVASYPFSSSSASSVTYVIPFVLNPTAEIADGFCVNDADQEEFGIHYAFGCWACPAPTPSPTTPPTVAFTSSPSNEVQTDDAGDGEGDDENENVGECCCCEKTKDLRSLIASLLD